MALSPWLQAGAGTRFLFCLLAVCPLVGVREGSGQTPLIPSRPHTYSLMAKPLLYRICHSFPSPTPDQSHVRSSSCSARGLLATVHSGSLMPDPHLPSSAAPKVASFTIIIVITNFPIIIMLFISVAVMVSEHPLVRTFRNHKFDTRSDLEQSSNVCLCLCVGLCVSVTMCVSILCGMCVHRCLCVIICVVCVVCDMWVYVSLCMCIAYGICMSVYVICGVGHVLCVVCDMSMCCVCRAWTLSVIRTMQLSCHES